MLKIILIVFGQHARKLDRNLGLGNDSFQVWHELGAVQLLVDLGLERVDGDGRVVVLVENINLALSKHAVGVQRNVDAGQAFAHFLQQLLFVFVELDGK